jgi:hypothetical protein
MIPRKREHLFQGRLSSQETSMLDQLCDREEMTRIQLFRSWIRREWTKIFGEKGEKE